MDQLRKLAASALSQLTEAGAESAECTVTSLRIDEINSLGKSIYLVREFQNSDIEMNAIVNGNLAMVLTNQTDSASLFSAAQRCVSMAKCSPGKSDRTVAFKGSNRVDVMLPMPWDKEKLYRRFEELTDTLRREYPSISSDAMAFLVERKSFYLNTKGDAVPHISQQCICNWQGGATDGKTVTDNEFFHFSCEDLDTPFIDQGMARAKLENAMHMLNPKKINREKFVGTLVLPPDQVASYAKQIVDRIQSMKEDDGLSSPHYSPSVSIFRAASDKKYANGMGPRNSPNAEVEYFVHNGEIVPSWEENSSQGNKPPSGNPLSHHIFGVENGDVLREELISGVKRGILIGHIQGTMPSENGEFSGAVKNSYYIENGKIVCPLIETMVSGNVFDLFQSVEGISSETIYADGQLAPWVACGGVTIL